MGNRKKEYCYDWRGSWAGMNSASFSVGIFRWMPKKSGGLKRSAVVYRIKGIQATKDKVFKRAEYLCDQLDAHGVELLEKKSETVK